jgi:hypothetical protein
MRLFCGVPRGSLRGSIPFSAGIHTVLFEVLCGAPRILGPPSASDNLSDNLVQAKDFTHKTHTRHTQDTHKLSQTTRASEAREGQERDAADRLCRDLALAYLARPSILPAPPPDTVLGLASLHHTLLSGANNFACQRDCYYRMQPCQRDLPKTYCQRRIAKDVSPKTYCQRRIVKDVLPKTYCQRRMQPCQRDQRRMQPCQRDQRRMQPCQRVSKESDGS